MTAYKRTLKTITVAELMDLLQDEDPDAQVIFSTDYGDYHHTPQALGLRGEVETTEIAESAYSNSGFQLARFDEDDDETEQQQTYLLIR